MVGIAGDGVDNFSNTTLATAIQTVARASPSYGIGDTGVVCGAATLGATLGLDFTDSNTALDPRITYSGASARTYFDSTGTLKYAPHNLLTASADFNDAAWNAKTNVTLTSGIADPFGGTSAWTMTRTSGASSAVLGDSFTGVSGATYTGAWYVRRRSGSGTVDLVVGDNVNQTINPTSSWQRLSASNTTTSTTIRQYISLTGAGTDEIDIAFSSINLGTELFDYIPTTSAAVYLPRANAYQDHDPATLAPLGFLIEEQRTNLVPRSNFSGGGGLIVSSGETSPFGNPSFRITAPTGATTELFSSGTAINLGGIAHTVQVAVRANNSTVSSAVRIGITGTSTTRYVDYNPITFSVTAAGVTAFPVKHLQNGWVLVSFTYTGSQTDGQVRIRPLNTVSVDVDLMQLEAGAFPTSYIPTTTAAATRLADSASMTGTNFSSWYNQSEGTMVARYDAYAPTVLTTRVFQIGDGTGNNRIDGFMAVNQFVAFCVVGGVTQVNGSAVGTIGSGVVAESAIAYKLNDYAWLSNGGAVSTDTSATVPAVTQLGIGTRFDAAGTLNGHIQSLTYYRIRLANATLQALTS